MLPSLCGIGDEGNGSATGRPAGKKSAELDEVPSGTEDGKQRNKSLWGKLKTKLKIVLSVYQIQNALPWLLPTVAYPSAFEGLVTWMSFIELDFIRIVPMSCVFPYNFFNKLFGSTMFHWPWRR